MRKVHDNLYRSARPGYDEERNDRSTVDRFIAGLKERGIASIITMLDQHQLAGYDLPRSMGLIEYYRRAGFRVVHRPVRDHATPPVPQATLELILSDYLDCPKPVLIHCSAGCSRTGAVIRFLERCGADAFYRQVIELATDCATVRPLAHFRQVATLALQLYDLLQAKHGLPAAWRATLWMGAMLHDIGTVYPETPNHACTSGRMIADRHFQSPPQVEPFNAATIAGLHGISPDPAYPLGPMNGPFNNDGTGSICRDLQVLVAILRVADGFDRDLSQAVQGLRLSQNVISCVPHKDPNTASAKHKQALLQQLLQVRVE